MRGLLLRLTPSERRVLGFLVGWALLGALSSALPWTASFSSSGRERVVIPSHDPRALLHARSLALAAHLERARTPPPTPLDPNRASREQLDRLPGVGPRTALRWIAARAASGPFFALSDLHRVKGLGPKRLEALAPHLRFAPARRAGARTQTASGVNLNRASATELAALPRVGPALAARIVAYRRSHGRFRSLGDLDGVPGVGPATLRSLTGRVRFE